MQVLVTGGTGLVGRFIVRDLLAAGHQLKLLGRTPPPAGAFPAGAGFMPWRLGEAGALPPAAALVHAALDHVPGAYRGGEGDDPQGFWERNFDGSLRLVEDAMAAGVGRVVFLSSRAVYGEVRAGALLREADPVELGTHYGRLKLATEQALAALRPRGLRMVALRATGVYGLCPGWRDHKWRGLFASYLAGEAIASRVGTEVHGEDLAAAVRLTLETGAEGVFNVSDLVLDRHDLLARVRALTGTPHPPPPPADRLGLGLMATDRLRELGWSPGGEALLAASLPGLVAAVHT